MGLHKGLCFFLYLLSIVGYMATIKFHSKSLLLLLGIPILVQLDGQIRMGTQGPATISLRYSKSKFDLFWALDE